MSDAVERRAAFKSAWINYYRNERDRSEACLRDIMEVLEVRDSSDADNIDAIFGRLIKHYARS